MFVFADVTNGVFALVGVLVGSLVTSLWAYVSERRQSRAALYVAAYSCLTRWRKVELAHASKPHSIQNEVTNLGHDLDNYMVAIPRVLGRRERNRHEGIYTGMVTIFSERDLMQPLSDEDEQRIGDAITPLEDAIRQEFGRPSFPARLLRLDPGPQRGWRKSVPSLHHLLDAIASRCRGTRAGTRLSGKTKAPSATSGR